MSQPKYKLMYFNLRGRAEVIRLMFVAAGVEYEDFRFTKEEWPQHKLGTPHGKVPVLVVNGNKICETGAIVRYLARELKQLDGNTSLEKARADMLFHTLNDTGAKFPTASLDKASDEEKAKLIQEWIDEHMTPFFEKLEKYCNEHVGEYLVCKDLTYFDLMVETTLHSMKNISPCFIDKFPKIKAIVEKIENMPKIKQWMNERPVTDF